MSSSSNLTETRRIVGGLAKHSRTLTLIGIAVVGLVVLGAIATQFSDAKGNEAREAYFRARQTLDKELTALVPAAPAAKANPKANTIPPAAPKTESVAFKKLDVDTQLAGSVKELKQVVEKYGSTRSGYEARLALGDLYFDHGEPAKALSWYQEAADKAPSKEEKGLALYSLGYAHESSGKYQDAIQAFDKAQSQASERGLKGDILLATARNHEALKDKAKASAAYDQILTQLPNTQYAKTAEILKSRLQ